MSKIIQMTMYEIKEILYDIWKETSKLNGIYRIEAEESAIISVASIP